MSGRATYLRGGLFLGLAVGAWLAAESASAQTRPPLSKSPADSGKKQTTAGKGNPAPKGGTAGSTTPALPYRPARPLTSSPQPLSNSARLLGPLPLSGLSPVASTVTSGVPFPSLSSQSPFLSSPSNSLYSNLGYNPLNLGPFANPLSNPYGLGPDRKSTRLNSSH